MSASRPRHTYTDRRHFFSIFQVSERIVGKSAVSAFKRMAQHRRTNHLYFLQSSNYSVCGARLSVGVSSAFFIRAFGGGDFSRLLFVGVGLVAPPPALCLGFLPSRRLSVSDIRTSVSAFLFTPFCHELQFFFRLVADLRFYSLSLQI